jgi:O-antigen biosynthesis protein
MDKTLSIVIPVFNRWNFTKSCLQDLCQLPDDHEIIVVDNGSSDETPVELEKLSDPKLKIKQLPWNLGFAGACNIGYGESQAPNVLFLNNDIRVKSQHQIWTQELLKYCSQALVGPTMGQLDDQLNFIQEANRVLPGKSYMSGWCLASCKDIWLQLRIPRCAGVTEIVPQIFSEEFGLAYFEDTDLSFRARHQKIPFQVVDLPVVHFGKQTSKQLNTHQLYSQARKIFLQKWSRKS